MTDTDTTANPTAARPHVDLRKKGWGLATKSDDSRSGDREEEVWLDIDDIDADYTQNRARFPLYEYAGKPCSFCESDITDLLDTLPHEQLQPVVVSVNPVTRRHDLEEGFRRYFAMTVLRDRGIRPERGWVLLCRRVGRKKSSADYGEAIVRAGAMQSLKPLSPIDLAHYAEWLTKPAAQNGCEMSHETARAKLAVIMQHNPSFRVSVGATEISEQVFGRLLRLTALSAESKREVHEGKLTWTKALSRASKRGEGNVRGPSGPQTPRGFKPREFLAFADSAEFASAVPATVTREEVLALLGHAGDASREPPMWLAKAKGAWARAVASARREEGSAPKHPPRPDKQAQARAAAE